jgi:release factor glutamine methyltransferase
MKTLKHKNIKTYATDISQKALRIASRNAQHHRVHIDCRRGHLLQPIIQDSKFKILNSSSVIITANLPYLTQAQFDSEPSIQREPRSALVAGNNGLALYEQLLSQLASLISNIKYPIFIFLEIDPSQTEPIKFLIHKYLPDAKVEIKTDLARRDRVVKIVLT